MQIPSSLFKKNREKLKKKLPKQSLAILHSNDQMPRTADQVFKFRQNSDFFYLTGIEQEKSVLILCPDHPVENLKEILLIIKADKTLEKWEGHKLSISEAQHISGIKNVKLLDEYDPIVHQTMVHTKEVYINIPELAKFKQDIPDRNERMFKELKNKYPIHEYRRLAPLMTELRLIKEQAELETIKKAISITEQAFLRVLKHIQPGQKEYEIEAELIHEFIRCGAKGHAFNPIIASGANACTLHYEENKDVMNENELVLLDFGAEYLNYSSDCSRTIPVNGQFTARQREVYQACLDVFKYARSLLKPGISITSWHTRVCKKWEEKHIELGLYTTVDTNNSKDKLWFKYYMHGTGHFMGLDTHDVGGKDIPLKPGMVLTCEPGIYIEEEELGIRLENDILITENGYIDLMENIPIEIDDIEKLMREKG